ncbi:hypothetical protein [Sphingorhabdus sp.]|uniref:hypothetical protein n=1 Tax=Sphingorhabdus sp. TaxID=1902408 RepID=UPI004053E83E
MSINAEARMGGYGSGRRSNRWTTDDCLHINLSNLKQLSKLQRNWMARHEEVWSQRGQTIADLTLVTDVHCLEPSPCLRITGRAFGKAIDCVVYLEEQPLPYGGERWYALCPRTGRRCTALVLPPGQTHFASVKGWNVSYASTREDEVGRAIRAMHKLDKNRPSKYARKSVHERYERRHMKAFETICAWEDRMAHLL